MRLFRLTRPSEAVARAVPVAALAAASAALVWDTHGSIAARDWLPYALLVALVLATVAAAGATVRPAREAVIGGTALVGLAGWGAISILWSPVASLARDEAPLVLFYALAFAVPVTTLVRSGDRLRAVAAVVAALTAIAIVTGVRIGLAANPYAFFSGGRLDSPISYANATAAVFALGI